MVLRVVCDLDRNISIGYIVIGFKMWMENNSWVVGKNRSFFSFWLYK